MIGRLTAAALICAFACFSCKPRADSASDTKFYGKDSMSADFGFSTYLLVEMPEGTSDPSHMLSKPNLKDTVDFEIDWQLQHMFGAFTEHDEYVNNPGIPYNRPVITITGAEAGPSEKFARINYTYKNRVVFQKSFLKDGEREIEFPLPKEVTGIYARSCPSKFAWTFEEIGTYCLSKAPVEEELQDESVLEALIEKNPCTDHHYDSMGDFWYFWNPKADGCMIDAETDLVTVEATVTPIKSTRKTFPYYDKIYGDNGNGKTLDIVFLVGIDEDFKRGDLGRLTFKDALAGLKKMGFKVTLATSNKNEKNMTMKTGEFNAKLLLKLINPNSQKFISHSKKAIETADIFVYNGHSGLGGYLNLDRFSALNIPKEKSQIMFFNGCSTYSYYNADYFDQKATENDPTGIKNLDIVTTSIGADFALEGAHDVSFIRDLLDGSRPSWQKIMNNIYKVDPYLTALTHVNGDEDNPKTPRTGQ